MDLRQNLTPALLSYDGEGRIHQEARGEMVRFMAGILAETPEQIKAFNWSRYHYDEDRSSDNEYVFIRIEVPGKGKK